MPQYVSIQITGLDNLIGQLERMKGAGTRAGTRIFYQWGQDVMVEAKMRTPVAGDIEHGLAPGTLRDSGEVYLVPDDGLGRVQLVLFFGGEAWAYAALQHERLDFHHTVGQAKYLESAVIDGLEAMGRGFQEEFSAELQDAM